MLQKDYYSWLSLSQKTEKPSMNQDGNSLIKQQ